MKSFLQYLKFRENDGEVQKVASPGEMPMAKASGDDAEPIVPGDGSNQRILEMLKNSFNKFLDEKLLKAVERKKNYQRRRFEFTKYRNFKIFQHYWNRCQ